MFWKKRVAVWLCVSVSCAVCGCFGNEVERYDLSGNVTIGGKPVPLGEVSFAPDVQRGNSGPGAVAQIKDGRFETAPDRGTVGGPHRITVTGFDGLAPRRGNKDTHPLGNVLVAGHVIEADLPKADSSFDIELPEDVPTRGR
ncbi:MAG: hypothetical protein MI757_22965 [Pirellulales bacterium]|nr:hypothetical protein [Pirellulales bacterium]